MARHTDLSENLFQSIDTIVSSRIETLPYDKTIECYITNNDQAAEGIYTVKYQNANFEAVSDNPDFKVNERVYVQIPQGDFTQDKIIVRKKQLESIQKVKKLPLLLMAKSDNLVSYAVNQSTYSLAISDDESTSRESFVWNDEVYAGYTRLGVKVSIMTNLKYTMLSGDYGLKIEITGFNQAQTANNFDRANKSTEVYYLKLDDMVGSNFYNTNGFQNQEKVIDITNKVITAIKISFWQDGNFVSEEYGPVINQYIDFTNLQLYLGYDITDFDNDDTRLILYTKDGLQYSVNLNGKILYARFITLDRDTLTFIDNSNLFYSTTNLQMYWGKYNPNSATKSDIFDLMSYETTQITSTIDQDFELSTIRSRKKESFICALGTEDNILYRSNILYFDNISYLESSSILDIIEGFQVWPAEEENGYSGIYQIYGQDNIATNKIVTSSPHYLIITYVSANQDSSENGMRAGDVISWRVPINDTMIIAPREGIEYNITNELTDGCKVVVINGISYYEITQTLSAEDIDETDYYFRIPYYIRDYYSPKLTNNTISIRLFRGFDIYETSQELLFGTSGSQGNEYNCRLRLWRYNEEEIDLVGHKLYIHAIPLIDDINTIYYIEAEVYDYNNNLIEADSVEYHILTYDADNPQFKLTDSDPIGLQRISASTNITDYFSNVIEGIITINNTTYKAYLPLAITQSSNQIAINGSTVLTYDITGKKPFYAKTKLELLSKESEITTADTILKWYIYSPYNIDLRWYPKIQDGVLIPPSIYKQEANHQFALICVRQRIDNKTLDNQDDYIELNSTEVLEIYNSIQHELAELFELEMIENPTQEIQELIENTKEQVKAYQNMLYQLTQIVFYEHNEDILWIQPIYIIQNKYPGAMKNAESNQAFINQTEYIASTMVGRIDTDSDNPNTMSGLFMGVLGNTKDNTEVLGLYAYKQGKKFFCVDENGQLYIDGGLNQNNRIANITLERCSLKNNFFDFTESINQNDKDVILINDENETATIAINSAGTLFAANSITTPSIFFENVENPRLVLIKEKSNTQTFNSEVDTGYFYGTAAMAEVAARLQGVSGDIEARLSALERKTALLPDPGITPDEP